ncbi:MAG: hypothetical protein AAGD01_19310 [Acidobacteriota bacterium]
MPEASPPSRGPSKFLLAILTLGSLAVVVACLWDHPLGRWLFAAAAVTMPVAWMALGAGSGGRGISKRVAWSLGMVLGLYAATFAGLLWLAGVEGGGPRVGGLPVATVWMLLGLWIVPLAISTWAFVTTFDRHGLSPEELAALRSSAAEDEKVSSQEAAR